MSLTTSCWLAQTASPLMRFVFLRPRITPPASFPPRLTTTQLPLACVGIITLTGDSHPQAAAHAGRTRRRAGPEARPWSDVVIHCRAGYQTPPVGQPPLPPVVQARVYAPGEPAVLVIEKLLPLLDAAVIV